MDQTSFAEQMRFINVNMDMCDREWMKYEMMRRRLLLARGPITKDNFFIQLERDMFRKKLTLFKSIEDCIESKLNSPDERRLSAGEYMVFTEVIKSHIQCMRHLLLLMETLV